ncbi:hypothetical protein [Latilactobacillus graminis]|nr:hypothetical protein [Latilactobacillus graminis]QFP79505.1 hypothetical protein LG542_04340 [Latilactobacillus graminis]
MQSKRMNLIMTSIDNRLGKLTIPTFIFSIIFMTLIIIAGSNIVYREFIWGKIPAEIVNQRSYITTKSGTRYSLELRVKINNKKIIVNSDVGNGPFEVGQRVYVFYDGRNTKTIFFENNKTGTKIFVFIAIILDIIYLYLYYHFFKYKKSKEEH